MTVGARPALLHLWEAFSDRIEFLSIYVREAHPGENYPHHTSFEQKMRHAREWVEKDRIPWSVAVDSLDGKVHRSYQTLPNAVYLIDRHGRVAFRAMWAGQERQLRRAIEEFLDRERTTDTPIDLGTNEKMIVPILRGSAELDYAVGRAGAKAIKDFRKALGTPVYVFGKLLSKIEPVVNPGNRDIER